MQPTSHNNPADPGPIAKDPKRWAKWLQGKKGYTFGWISLILLVASLFLGGLTLNCSNFDGTETKFSPEKSLGSKSANTRAEAIKLNWLGKSKVGVLVFWILAPFAWFWLEYFGIYRYRRDAKESFEYFKYAQDISSKLWLALVTVLTVLYFGKDLKGGY
jgi:hypothetical protein